MKLTITKNDRGTSYRAECLDLLDVSIVPPVGEGATETMALASLFCRMSIDEFSASVGFVEINGQPWRRDAEQSDVASTSLKNEIAIVSNALIENMPASASQDMAVAASWQRIRAALSSAPPATPPAGVPVEVCQKVICDSAVHVTSDGREIAVTASLVDWSEFVDAYNEAAQRAEPAASGEPQQRVDRPVPGGGSRYTHGGTRAKVAIDDIETVLRNAYRANDDVQFDIAIESVERLKAEYHQEDKKIRAALSEALNWTREGFRTTTAAEAARDRVKHLVSKLAIESKSREEAERERDDALERAANIPVASDHWNDLPIGDIAHCNSAGKTFRQHVEDWLKVNKKTGKEKELYHGVFPLGMVGTWIHRAIRAEEKLTALTADHDKLTQNHQALAERLRVSEAKDKRIAELEAKLGPVMEFVRHWLKVMGRRPCDHEAWGIDGRRVTFGEIAVAIDAWDAAFYPDPATVAADSVERDLRSLLQNLAPFLIQSHNLPGVISQIDNWCAVTRNKLAEARSQLAAAQAEVERLTKELEGARRDNAINR